MFSDNKKSDSIAYMEAIIEQMEENEKNTNFNIRSYENKDYQSIESMQIFEDIKDTEVTQDFEKIQDIKEQHDFEKIQSFQTNILSKSSSKSFLDCEEDITDNQSEYENTYIQPEEQSNTTNDKQDVNMDNSTDEALISEDDDNEFIDNKIFAQVPYILGVVGVIIALLAAKDSKYVIYHVKQSLELIVCNVILTIILFPMIILSCMKDVGITFLIISVMIGMLEFMVYIMRFIGFFRSGSCKGYK